MTNIQSNASNRKGNITLLKFKTIFPFRQIPLGIQNYVFSGSSDISQRKRHRWHTHTDFFELVLVVKGNTDNTFPDGQTRQMREGDVMLLPPGSTHCYTAGKEMEHYNILFAPELAEMRPGFLSQTPNHPYLKPPPGTIPHILHLDSRELNTALAILKEMMQEQLNASPAHEEAMLVDFYRLFIHIARHATLAEETSNEASFASRLRQVIHFMQTNSSRELTLDQLCKQAAMSKSNFRYRFRDLTGHPPIEYLIRLRLQNAAILLQDSEYRITHVAHECGFLDSNYFSRKFRSVFHTTPRAFRQQCTSGKLNLNEELKKLNLHS